MAERPIFVPVPSDSDLVQEIYIDFPWHPGFAVVQKQKNVRALHSAAAAVGLSPLLEISTKSDEKLGRHLSAFHLKVRAANGEVSLESAFQGSKVFEHGGPFRDLYAAEPHIAKRDPRLAHSGRLVAFDFLGTQFALEPMTAFYDWLYISSIFPHRAWLHRLQRYAGFTDIEFNPERSINCQARSCALFVSLMARGLLDTAIESPVNFVNTLAQFTYRPRRPAPLSRRALVSALIVRQPGSGNPNESDKGRRSPRKRRR